MKIVGLIAIGFALGALTAGGYLFYQITKDYDKAFGYDFG